MGDVGFSGSHRGSEHGTRAQSAGNHDLRLIFVRHGQASDKGHEEELGPSLTDLGRTQAKRVAKRLAKERFQHIYASDMLRAHETALSVREFHKGTPFIVTRVLREIRGYMISPRKGTQADYRAMRNRRPKILRFVRQLLRKHRRDRRVLIVAHGDIIRFIISTLAGVNPKRAVLFDTSNTSVNEVIFLNGKFQWLYRTNDTRHLLPHQVS